MVETVYRVEPSGKAWAVWRIEGEHRDLMGGGAYGKRTAAVTMARAWAKGGRPGRVEILGRDSVEREPEPRRERPAQGSLL